MVLFYSGAVYASFLTDIMTTLQAAWVPALMSFLSNMFFCSLKYDLFIVNELNLSTIRRFHNTTAVLVEILLFITSLTDAATSFYTTATSVS